MIMRSLSCVAGILLVSYPLAAQTITEDRQRLAEVLGSVGSRPMESRAGTAGDSALSGYLWRLLPAASRMGVGVVGPEMRVTWNSALPYSMNDGPMWAGRGWNVSLSGGIAVEQKYHRAVVRAVIAPIVSYSQNLPFQVFPNRTPGRSGYANPFHGAESGASLDLPHRFGDRHRLGIDPGRTEVAVAFPEVTVGATTKNEWWGPGIRNAIVMSSNAPGVPRFYLQTTKPVRTPAGALSARLVSGTLTQSQFFDPAASENRTLSGVLLELVPAFDSTLTLGFSRIVYAPIGPQATPLTMTLARSFDALFRWENLNGAGDQRSDQIGSVFARWIFPQAGFEVYGEWARMDLPRTAHELLTAPHHTGAWTFGFNWANDRGRSRYLRLQSELSYLEQSRVFPDRPSPDFYSGQASPQGYTQRGQVIGAAIGPGASSQFIGLDWIVPGWQLGGFVGRIRWDNDALYREVAATFFRHDVSVLSGLRGGVRTRHTDFTVELTAARRYNYLFQNGFANPGNYRDVDVNNLTLALIATPR